MPKLHLGVVDIPYDYKGEEGKTTGDVAEILEAKYGIMEFFVQKYERDIADDLAKAAQGALENLMMGAPVTDRAFAAAEDAISERFRSFLDNREMDGQVPGVATEAAKRGVNHRLRHPYAKRQSRPSFIDTGLYQASMRTWVEIPPSDALTRKWTEAIREKLK